MTFYLCMHELIKYAYWLSVYMIANFTLRAFVEGSQLPSATWQQAGSSAEKTYLMLEGGT